MSAPSYDITHLKDCVPHTFIKMLMVHSKTENNVSCNALSPPCETVGELLQKWSNQNGN